MIVDCPSCHARYDVSGRPPGTRARCRCGMAFVLPKPTEDAGMLRCPQCGAAVAFTHSQCEYCHAPLLIRACPGCFGRVFHGSKHCHLCGVEIESPAPMDLPQPLTPRLCPGCLLEKRVPLEGRLVDNYLLDECGRCGGVFVDAHTLKSIIKQRKDLAHEDISGYASKAFIPLEFAPEPYVPSAANTTNWTRGTSRPAREIGG